MHVKIDGVEYMHKMQHDKLWEKDLRKETLVFKHITFFNSKSYA